MIGEEFWIKVFDKLGLEFILDSYQGLFEDEEDDNQESAAFFFYVMRKDCDKVVFDSVNDLGVSFDSESELLCWLRVNYEKVFNKIIDNYENKQRNTN